MLSGTNGNNITVVTEPVSDMYKTLTADEFMALVGPTYEAMGMSVSNLSVEQLKNALGTEITKIAMTTTSAGVSMTQTVYVVKSGDLNVSVTVTETVKDAKMVADVYATIKALK